MFFLIFLNHLFIFIVYSFNGARYDIPILLAFIYQYTLDPKRGCKVKAFRRGTIINSLNIIWTGSGKAKSKVYLTCRDVRQLVEPTISLEGLGKRYGLDGEGGKGLFPHSSNACLWTLQNTSTLPDEMSPEWRNDFSGARPSTEDIQRSLREFEERGYGSRYEYLLCYLQVTSRDVEVFFKYQFINSNLMILYFFGGSEGRLCSEFHLLVSLDRVA